MADFDVTADSAIVLSDSVYLTNDRAVTHSLSLSESMYLTSDQDVEDTLTLVSTGLLVYSETVAQTLSVTDSVAVVTSHYASSVLTVASSVAVMQTLHVSAADSIALVQGVLGRLNRLATNSCNETNPENLGTRDTILLEYDGNTLELRNPRFGNTYSTDNQTYNRRTRGGQLSLSRGDNWSRIKTLRMSFEGLTEAKRDEFIDFMKTASGFQVALTDHENRSWIGVIINPELVTTQTGRGCQYEAEFEYRGVLD